MFTYVAVLFLNKLEERRHVRASKVIDCFKASEHRRPGEPLKVVLADVLKHTLKLDNYQQNQHRTISMQMFLLAL